MRAFGLMTAALLVLTIHDATAFASGGNTVVPTEKVEVLIGNVFIPEKGYGDNDNIELTVDGYLADSCYQIAETTVERGTDPDTFVLHQLANHRTDGLCASGIVLYTQNVGLGTLPTGAYKVLFNVGLTPVRQSVFNVERARTPGVVEPEAHFDDYPYAEIRSISIPDVVNGVDEAGASLSGELTSACTFIKEVRVIPEGNVFVVLPIIGNTHRLCALTELPFQYKLRLGRLGEGRYLIHVRSMNGVAVTRAFSVVRPDPE